jgi:hypothetical protein
MSEEPGISVIAALTSPPVQLSAVTIIWLARISRSLTFFASTSVSLSSMV